MTGSVFWDLLTAAGGTLALTLIVAIALGLNALTLLFWALPWSRSSGSRRP